MDNKAQFLYYVRGYLWNQVYTFTNLAHKFNSRNSLGSNSKEKTGSNQITLCHSVLPVQKELNVTCPDFLQRHKKQNKEI